MLLVALAVASSAGAAPHKSVRIQIIDCGQADGIVIRTPNDKWIVIDGGPSAIAVSDLNGDNTLDFVTANRDGDGVGVVLGRRELQFQSTLYFPVGDGTFQKALSTSTGMAPRAVAVAHLDDDMIPDLVTSNVASGDVTLCRGSFARFCGSGRPQRRHISRYCHGQRNRR